MMRSYKYRLAVERWILVLVVAIYERSGPKKAVERRRPGFRSWGGVGVRAVAASRTRRRACVVWGPRCGYR